MIVDISIGPQEFFKEKVSHAANQLKIPLEDQTEFYLVNLLCDFIKLGSTEPELFKKPLAFMLQEAEEQPPTNRIKTFKKLGDISLYVGGYFHQFFRNKTYSSSYYSIMGATAYQRVSTLMKNIYSDDDFSKLYYSLSNQFNDLIDVMTEVSESNTMMTNQKIIESYDRYLKTGSEELEKNLLEQGIKLCS